MEPLGSRTFLSCLVPPSEEEAEPPSFSPGEEAPFDSEGVGRPIREGPVWLKVAWGVEGERQRDGRVPPGPVLTVVGLSRGGGVKGAPLRPSWLSSEPSSVSSSDESTSWMASCFCSDSRRSARSCLMADSLSFSLLFPGARPSGPDAAPRAPSPSWRPSFLEEECLPSSPSLADSWGQRNKGEEAGSESSGDPGDLTWRLCRLGSRCRISFLNSECETSRLCFRPPAAAPPEGEEGEPEREAASFSADWTLLRRGERGGSALLGLDICLTRGGEECSFTGNDWPMAPWPGSGEGERWGELLCGVGDGVRARGDRGMLPADLRRGERYWRWSLGARPCRELGRMWPELAGEFGTLELGELLWEEFPPTDGEKTVTIKSMLVTLQHS